MGEEVKTSEYEPNGDDGDDNGGEYDRVLDWEMGLPTGDDLTPLSQLLIPPELAAAFSISPEQSRTIHDIDRESQNTLSMLRNCSVHASEEADEDRVGSSCIGFDPKRQKQSDGGGAAAAEEADSDRTALKRPRLVWTPQLHKRFVDVVTHLGIKNAVPKTIMQLMNVEGLTRENVASHLQKYRLYLKRMQGLTTTAEGPSSSSYDQLFSSTLVPPQSFHDAGMPVSVPYKK